MGRAERKTHPAPVIFTLLRLMMLDFRIYIYCEVRFFASCLLLHAFPRMCFVLFLCWLCVQLSKNTKRIFFWLLAVCRWHPHDMWHEDFASLAFLFLGRFFFAETARKQSVSFEDEIKIQRAKATGNRRGEKKMTRTHWTRSGNCF